jgi:UDP-N-acetylmuramyl pentapeptide phosphotransferase/UDP-N-acetylglucosamine-1-phosphate transferase
MSIHNACMITIISTVLFGFTDDMLDFAWRYKLLYPFFFMIPVIKVFNGSTLI